MSQILEKLTSDFIQVMKQHIEKCADGTIVAVKIHEDHMEIIKEIMVDRDCEHPKYDEMVENIHRYVSILKMVSIPGDITFPLNIVVKKESGKVYGRNPFKLVSVETNKSIVTKILVKHSMGALVSMVDDDVNELKNILTVTYEQRKDIELKTALDLLDKI